MKTSSFAIFSLATLLVGCEGISNSLNEPISGEFDPLSGPGFRLRSESGLKTAPAGPGYQPGQWVEAAVPNTMFFRRFPKGNASADQILKAGTPLKVVSTQGSHVKVELENGQVGYVPTIMVAEPSLTGEQDTPFLPSPPSSLTEAPPSIEVETAPLMDSGDSVIPPPSFETPPAAPAEEDTAPGTRKPNEIVIPVSPPAAETPDPVETDTALPEGLIPPPSGASDAVDTGFGIE